MLKLASKEPKKVEIGGGIFYYHPKSATWIINFMVSHSDNGKIMNLLGLIDADENKVDNNKKSTLKDEPEELHQLTTIERLKLIKDAMNEMAEYKNFIKELFSEYVIDWDEIYDAEDKKVPFNKEYFILIPDDVIMKFTQNVILPDIRYALKKNEENDSELKNS